MKVFHCDHCHHLLFFENVKCVHCHHTLAYLPDLGVIGSLDPVGDDLWKSPLKRAAKKRWRLCENYTHENVCNWAVSAADPNPLCVSCRLTRVIPDLSQPANKEAWYRLEVAKRRLVYSLLGLNLPLPTKMEDADEGLAFEFLADTGGSDASVVLTGHDNGLITLNIAEADDAERERRRLQLREPYRTLLGHFRHEIGHYYWDRLIKDSPHLVRFRELFGDEQQDYGEALKRYYETGAPTDWQQRFVSAYASAHPWEDWAETWAHYLHMADALETAGDCGLSLKPNDPDRPVLEPTGKPPTDEAFDRLINNWFALTYVVNNLNRGLGLPDGYPFVLSPTAVEKLNFIHDVIGLPKKKSKANARKKVAV